MWFTHSLFTCQLSHTLILSEIISKSRDHALAASMTERFQFLTQFRLVSFTAVWVLLGEKCLKHFQFLEGLHSLLKICIFLPLEGIFQFSEYADHVLQIKYCLKKHFRVYIILKLAKPGLQLPPSFFLKLNKWG